MSETVATLFGDYLIVARAAPAGTRWAGFYKINQFADDGTRSMVFEDEEELETTFESRQEALEAARVEAEAAIGRLGKKSHWL